jgi:uncharacterized protein (DUF302 family)
MQDTNYGIRVELAVGYEQAIEKVTAALKGEGFGVLTTIDVKQTMKAKLDVDFRKYTILGACNPPIAHKALSAEPEIGLLLPCNVIVYESGPGRSVVASVAPLVTLGRVGNEALAPLGIEVDAKLRRVMASLDESQAGV